MRSLSQKKKGFTLVDIIFALVLIVFRNGQTVWSTKVVPEVSRRKELDNVPTSRMSDIARVVFKLNTTIC